AANGLSTEARVVAGTNLTIPAPGQAPTPPVTPAPSSPGTTTAPAATGGGGYRVQPGDTLSAIAARQGVSLGSLAAANGLKLDSWVIQGTTLKLPAPGSAPVAQVAPATGQGAPEAMGAYKVRPGDTLTGLAAASRVPAAQMAYMNGLNPNAQLIAGTIIKLPTGAAITPTAPAPAQTIVPQAAPMASPGRLSAGQVGTLAAQSGAPSSLAAAIAWQESGFNNAMISPANARGVMQVMPGTWSWVQANLSQARLDPSSPTDNVKAGSLYLAHLLRETNGDPALAAAGYYQGLASVRRIGMLPETRRYVANVLALRGRFGG
ncbi:MAG: LysM peptidoglycan-binding domain-containing protein, partial [Solirubrobacteraceae bacterium]